MKTPGMFNSVQSLTAVVGLGLIQIEGGDESLFQVPTVDVLFLKQGGMQKLNSPPSTIPPSSESEGLKQPTSAPCWVIPKKASSDHNQGLVYRKFE